MRKIIFLALFVSLFVWGFQLAPIDKADAQCDNSPCDNYTPVLVIGGGGNHTEFIQIAPGDIYGVGCVFGTRTPADDLSLNIPPADCASCAAGFEWTVFDLAGNDVTATVGAEAVACADAAASPNCTFYFDATTAAAYYHVRARCLSNPNLAFHWGLLGDL